MTLPRRLISILALKGRLSDWIGSRTGPLGSYVLTAAFVGAALGVRLLMNPWLTGAQFITFFPAVILATLLFGTSSGLFSVALATVAARYFLQAAGFDIQEAYALLLFAGVALMDVAIIVLLLATNSALRASVARIEHLNAGLSASEAKFRNLLETAPDAMIIADGQERIALVNAEAERMFGYPRAALLGKPIAALMPERFRGEHDGRIAAFHANPRISRMGYGRELYGLRSDGQEFPIETNLSLLTVGEGGLVSSAIRDISARREAEERQVLLIRELNHRVKNALASVQAIVSHTLTTARTPGAFSAALTARLAALSQSHDVLTRNDWSGADVGELVLEQLGPYGGRADDRFQVSGPKVRLTPNRAVTLGMVLGELATNAAKYGALSLDRGIVSVSWECGADAEASQLRLVWSEHGGPPVRAPKNHGFGTRLIERSVSGALAGTVQLAFRSTGLRCEIAFPLQAGET